MIHTNYSSEQLEKLPHIDNPLSAAIVDYDDIDLKSIKEEDLVSMAVKIVKGTFYYMDADMREDLVNKNLRHIESKDHLDELDADSFSDSDILEAALGYIVNNATLKYRKELIPKVTRGILGVLQDAKALEESHNQLLANSQLPAETV